MSLRPDLFPVWLMEGKIDTWTGAIVTAATAIVALWLARRSETIETKRRQAELKRIDGIAANSLRQAFNRLVALDDLHLARPTAQAPKYNILMVVATIEAAARHALSLNPQDPALLDAALNALAIATHIRESSAGHDGDTIPSVLISEHLTREREMIRAYAGAMARKTKRPSIPDKEIVSRINSLWTEASSAD